MVVNISFGEKLLIRLVDTLENGIGGLLKPWQTKRMGGADLENEKDRRFGLAVF